MRLRALAWLTALVSLAACHGGNATALDATFDASPAASDASDDARFDAASDASDDDASNDLDARFPLVRPPFDAGDAPLGCEIGALQEEEEDAGTWAPLSGNIPIGGSGQAGLTARLAVRITDPNGPIMLQSAIVEVVLTNPLNGEVAPSKPWDTPIELVCDDDACDAAPIYIEISHVAKLPELEGLEVWLDATVRDAEDRTRVLAAAASSGTLYRF
jgi:hypothetical protein